MELMLLKELILGVSQGKKDVVLICLILLFSYRFYKLVKFSFFELKKRDDKIAELEDRILKQELIEKERGVKND